MSVETRSPKCETPRNVFLIGYRGSGKTSVGRLLAQQVGWRFVDADVALEEYFRTTIRDIFETEGESAFRDKEARICDRICQAEEQIVATGGGLILREENRHRIRESGFVVWLKAEPETIRERIRSDETTEQRRPNLRGGGLDEIRSILAERLPLYEATADWIIDTEGPVGPLHSGPASPGRALREISGSIVERLFGTREIRSDDVQG